MQAFFLCRTHPAIGLTIGVLDATGTSDAVYKSLGEAVEGIPGLIEGIPVFIDTHLIAPINSMNRSLGQGTWHP